MATVLLKTEDASGAKKTFSIEAEDGHEKEVDEQVDAFVDLKLERELQPVQNELKKSQAQLKKARERLADEIIRIKKLTSDGEEFDAEKEREYLLGSDDVEGLSTERLIMEFNRTPGAEEISVQPVTKGGAPKDEGEPFADFDPDKE